MTVDKKMRSLVEAELKRIFYLPYRKEQTEEIKNDPDPSLVISWDQKSYVKPGNKLITLSYIYQKRSGRWFFFPDGALFPIYPELMMLFGDNVMVQRLVSHIIFNAGIQEFLSSGKVYINVVKQPPLMEVIESLKKDTYAIGIDLNADTPKIYVGLGRLGEDLHYFRIPSSSTISHKLQNESMILEKVERNVLENISHPYELSGANSSVNLKTRALRMPLLMYKSRKFTSFHAQAIAELSYKTIHQRKLKELSFYQRLCSYINTYESQPFDDFTDARLIKWKKIHERLEIIHGLLREEDYVPCAISNGKFHRDKIFLIFKKVLLTNWECAEENKPILYDVFDYIYHQNCFIYQRPFNRILKELEYTFNEKAINELVETWGLSPDHLHLWYLLDKIVQLFDNENFMDKDIVNLHTLSVIKHALEYVISACNFTKVTALPESEAEMMSWT